MATPLTRRDPLLAGAVALLVIVLGGQRLVPGVVGAYHDDGIYASTARALADGRGYTLVHLPETPPQTKYPVLFPAVLAGLVLIRPTFADALVAMQWLTLLTAALAVGLSYLYLVRFGYAGRVSAAAATALFATTPAASFYGSQVLSEMPFAVLVVAGLWRLEATLEQDGPSLGAQLATGLLIALPLVCRAAGLATLLAGVAIVIARRAPVRWVLIGVLPIAGLWLYPTLRGWLVSPGDDVLGYYTDYAGAWTAIAGSRIVQVATRNAVFALHELGRLGIEGVAPARAGGLSLPLFVGLGALLLGQLTRAAWRGRVLPVSLLAYLTMLAVWPWPPGRFLVPLLPLFLPYLVAATRVDESKGLRRAATLLALALLATMNARLSVTYADRSQRDRFPYPNGSLSVEAVQWSSYDRLFAWLRRETAPSAVVASGMDTMVYLYAERPAFRPFALRADALFYGSPIPPTGTAAELRSALTRHGARYLAMTPMIGFGEEAAFVRQVAEARRRYPDLLTVVYQAADPRFVVYRIGEPEDQRLSSGAK
jgi:hypothetical protein